MAVMIDILPAINYMPVIIVLNINVLVTGFFFKNEVVSVKVKPLECKSEVTEGFAMAYHYYHSLQSMRLLAHISFLSSLICPLTCLMQIFLDVFSMS